MGWTIWTALTIQINSAAITNADKLYTNLERVAGQAKAKFKAKSPRRRDIGIEDIIACNPSLILVR